MMDSFATLESLVVPVARANVDTDAIIPKQFMKSIARTGFGDNLFDEWRYLDRGEPGQDCSLRPRNEAFFAVKFQALSDLDDYCVGLPHGDLRTESNAGLSEFEDLHLFGEIKARYSHASPE